MSKSIRGCGSFSRLGLVTIAVLLFGSFAMALGQDVEQIDVAVAKSQKTEMAGGLSMRVRLTAITPAEPSEIHWRHGGEGQGGDVIRGVFAKPAAEEDDAHELQIGQWSSWTPVGLLSRGRMPEKFFLTITAGKPGNVVDRVTRRRGGYSTDARFEVEFRYRNKLIKRLAERGPDGGTVTVVIPTYRLVDGTPPDDPKFISELTGVLQYATERAKFLESLPWAGGPLPKRYLLINNIGGYGTGSGYGIRTTDKAVTWAELCSLKQLGVNGLRTPPEFLVEMLRNGDPRMQSFRRGLLMPMMGFPVPRYREGRETLDPREDAEVLARFADAPASVVCHQYGRGQAYVVGLFPGLEYSATVRSAEYNMRQEFPADRRTLIAAPALALTTPVVDVSDPLVEGVLLRSAAGKQRAVTLANWAYETGATVKDARGRQRTLVAHLPVENVKVTIRGAGKVDRATSYMLDRQLKVTTSGETVAFTLPRLEEGDVVVLE